MSAASTTERRLAWREHYRRYGRRGVSQRARRAFRNLPPREQLRRSIRKIEALDKWEVGSSRAGTALAPHPRTERARVIGSD
jgi:hypothetical protein